MWILKTKQKEPALNFDSVRLARLEQKNSDVREFANRLLDDSISPEQILKWTDIPYKELLQMMKNRQRYVQGGKVQLKY